MGFDKPFDNLKAERNPSFSVLVVVSPIAFPP